MRLLSLVLLGGLVAAQSQNQNATEPSSPPSSGTPPSNSASNSASNPPSSNAPNSNTPSSNPPSSASNPPSAPPPSAGSGSGSGSPFPSATATPTLSALISEPPSTRILGSGSSVSISVMPSATATGFPMLAPGVGPSEPNNAPIPTPTGSVFYSMPGPIAFNTPTKPAWGAFWSYPQPPIPATSTTYNPAAYTAAFSNEDIAAAPTTREYDFTMHYAAGWPSGFLRRMAVINNQFPGPLIEANRGDTIVVHVHNQLDIPQSIHWHGIRQNGSNAMDGVPGFSQCPIPPGGSFTYRFQVPVEVGTFWYHSHYGNTLADGLVGGLIVHAPDDPLKRGVDYDDDRIVYLGDWMHDQSEVIIDNEKNLFKPYRGLPFVAEPDAALINGVGQSDCDRAQRGVPCGVNPPAEIWAEQGKRVRLRLINHAGHALIRFSIDNHVLTVIEADDTPIEPVEVNEVPVGAGQRYSVVVTLNQGPVGSSFWIRARVGTFCINPFATVNERGILRYADTAGGGTSKTDPESKPWSNLKNPNLSVCKDLDEEGVKLVPRIPEDAPSSASSVWPLTSLFGIFTEPVERTPMIGFGMNGVMYKNMINDPLLNRISDGRGIPGINGEVAAVTFDGKGAADIIINVLDPPPLAHPFHLHGRPFYIIARGPGAIGRLGHIFVRKNLKNPLRRDTLMIKQWSYAILRVKLDNPGVWPLHCHIGWHLASGKMAAVTIGTPSIRAQEQPEDWKALCAGLDPDVIGPGRKRGLMSRNESLWRGIEDEEVF